ncbi:MAG TPA: isocitrate/isopropylmalate family dehydrogenase [Rubellimicrobium sp.]|nr:isocitrate/isopropylmalate family dehydrogenase [Rubellimicrobium sp.]
MATRYPEVSWDEYHIDIRTARSMLDPNCFDVIVGSNLFGDILSDFGPACTGRFGIAPSGNFNPERRFPSLFEPVHGSAPDIAGKGIANFLGQIWAGSMMLDQLGEATASAAILAAVEASLLRPERRPRHFSDQADTTRCGGAVARDLLDPELMRSALAVVGWTKGKRRVRVCSRSAPSRLEDSQSWTRGRASITRTMSGYVTRELGNRRAADGRRPCVWGSGLRSDLDQKL